VRYNWKLYVLFINRTQLRDIIFHRRYTTCNTLTKDTTERNYKKSKK